MAGFHGPAKLLSRLGIDMAWRPGLDPSNDRLSVRVSAATGGWTVTQTDAPTPMLASNTTSGSARPATTVRSRAPWTGSDYQHPC